MHKLSLALMASASLGLSSVNAQTTELTEPGDIYNYVVGYQVTNRVLQKLAEDGVEVSLAAFQAGIEDSLNKAQPRFSQEQVVAAIQQIQAGQESKKTALANANLEQGTAFLSENATKEGVTVLDSGLQYSVAQAGTGDTPTAESTVVVHYRGTLLDGEEFDSSYARGQPARFSAGGVIPGFREALTNMKEGAKWRVFIPSALAYGENGAGGKIGPNQTLIFDLELIEIVKE